MTAPKNRDELIEVMARELGRLTKLTLPTPVGIYADGSKIGECFARARAALEAIEANGCAVVPVEATEGMVQRMCVAWDQFAKVDNRMWNAYIRAIQSSPYSKGTDNGR